VWNLSRSLLIGMLLAQATCVLAEPTVESTEYLGPFTGVDAELHPANLAPERAQYYGTDLGFSYAHGEYIHFLFGDTLSNENGDRIDTETGGLYDDMYGMIRISDWPDPSLITADNIPLIQLGQYPNSDQLISIDPGHVFDDLKTPEAGFSNGTNEFAVLLLTKPEGCATDADCSNGMSCDVGLGYLGTPYSDPRGTTLACIDGTPFCASDTMQTLDGHAIPDTGICIDTSSSIWGETAGGRVSAYSLKQRIGIRDHAKPYKYRKVSDWMTNKFLNTTVSTVECFDPEAAPDDARQNYSIAEGAGGCRRLLLWGRPGFTGVLARGRYMGVYLAYVDMPRAPDFEFELHYFTGVDESGQPQFSTVEQEAMPLDLDASQDGNQPEEHHDIVNHMSVSWIEPLDRWVMFYGGGIDITPIPAAGLVNCGLLEIFAGSECKDVDPGNGAVRMRTAKNPWGPWSLPQDVVVGGDPETGTGQFGVGGALGHPDCNEPGCSPRSNVPVMHDQGYGWFYGVNIIEQWTRPVGDGVDVIWLASTWDPYRVVLFRTHIAP